MWLGVRKSADAWFDEHFPSRRARAVADKAVDKLEVTRPMTDYIDT